MRLSFEDPPSEYASLPDVLVQISRKLRPKGVIWLEISRSMNFYHAVKNVLKRKERSRKVSYRRNGWRPT